MTEFIINIIDQIQNYSTSISKKATFLEKPWALVDDEMEVQKLIFQKDNQLILSKNGKVQMGTWEYLAGAKSMLIDRGSDKILLNEVFINDDVMILKIDGTKHEFFVLANQNTIPDLDVLDYFNRLRLKHLQSTKVKLKNGQILTMYYPESKHALIGNLLFINNEMVKDGTYEREDDKLFFVQNGRITKTYHQKYYLTPEGLELRLLQSVSNIIQTTEFIYLNGERIMDGEVNYTSSHVLIVENGKVKDVKSKKSILQSIINLFKKNQ